MTLDRGSSSETVEQRAAKVLLDACGVQFNSRFHDWKCPRDHHLEASMLASAGLLRTELHERALAACGSLASVGPEKWWLALSRCQDVGREALEAQRADTLAAERAKEPALWTAGKLGDTEPVETWGLFRHGLPLPAAFSKEQAKVVADALNKLERQP